jgi:hypothetical protein
MAFALSAIFTSDLAGLRPAALGQLSLRLTALIAIEMPLSFSQMAFFAC